MFLADFISMGQILPPGYQVNLLRMVSMDWDILTLDIVSDSCHFAFGSSDISVRQKRIA